MAKRDQKSTSSSTSPELHTKSRPSRRNGKDTFETIMTTTGELLAEVGFERLTTNLVCERAGMTPPALYRYFPNKYALLAELARRLMDVQDQVFFEWLDSGGFEADSLDEAVEKSIKYQKAHVALTRSFPGGMWILRATNADPVLRSVRVTSRDNVLRHYFEKVRSSYPHVSIERLKVAIRVVEQASYGIVEMLLEEPDLNEDRVIEETSWMTCVYFRHLSLRYRPLRLDGATKVTSKETKRASKA